MTVRSLAACTLVLTPALLPGAPVDGYPSLPSKVLSTYQPTKVEKHTPAVMAERAGAFLAALDEKLRKQAALPIDSPERAKWTNVPPRGPQGGVRLGDLDEKQLKLACDLLAAVLSEQGYLKARNIPLADDRLLRNGERRPGFGAEDYWLAIFGSPSPTKPWGLQFDGHHIAINLSFHGDGMSMSPSFIGTQPSAFELGDEKVVPMANESPAALALLESLDDEQRKKAVVGDKRANLAAGAGRDGFIPEAVGLPCAALDEKQQAALVGMVKQYVGDLPAPFAERRLAELKGELAKMSFAWWGPAKEGGDLSYRLQGPSLIIEYAGQNLGGDPDNHLHSIYRDPTNEYGARLGK